VSSSAAPTDCESVRTRKRPVPAQSHPLRVRVTSADDLLILLWDAGRDNRQGRVLLSGMSGRASFAWMPGREESCTEQTLHEVCSTATFGVCINFL
jgi:hypothetical protein